METPTSRRSPLGGILMIVGGALAAVGSFLTWAEVTVGDQSASATGMDGSDGYLTLIGGVILVVAGVVAMRTTNRRFAILGIVAGLLVAGVGIYDAVTAEDSVRDSLAIFSGVGEIEVSIAIGLFLVIGAGIIGMIGGVIAAATANRDALAAAPSMPGAAPVTMGTAPGAMGTTSTPPAGPPPPPPGTPSE
jgi:hypothetical protein